MDNVQMTFDQLHDKVCRLCLEAKPQLAELEGLYFDELTFNELIKDCFAIDINLAQRNLPLGICKKCIVATLNFHALKTKVIENEVFLQTMAVSKAPLRDINLTDATSSSSSSSSSSGISSESKEATTNCALCEKRCNQYPTAETACVGETKAYECSACEKKFSTPGEWKAHMISHYSSNKYACVKCADTFTSKHELVAHNYTHLYKPPTTPIV